MRHILALYLSLSSIALAQDLQFENRTRTTVFLAISDNDAQIDRITLNPGETRTVKIHSHTKISWEGIRSWDLLRMVYKAKPEIYGLNCRVKLIETPGALFTSYDVSVSLNDNTAVVDDRWHDVSWHRRLELALKTEQDLNPLAVGRALYYHNGEIDISENTKINQPRVVVILVHGTWSSWGSDFANLNNPIFRSVLNQAANEFRFVEVVSFQWSGHNNNNERLKAASVLATLINQVFAKEQFTGLVTIAHSHGGNVVHAATFDLIRPIDVLVNIFTPIRLDHPQFLPHPAGFLQHHNFFSLGDNIQVAGAYHLSLGKPIGDGRRMPIQKGKIMRNIKVQIDQKDPGHHDKIMVMSHLFEALKQIEEVNPNADQIRVNIRPQRPTAADRIQLAVRLPRSALVQIDQAKATSEWSSVPAMQ